MKIQYVIVRNDTGFTQGATAAQAVHAAVLCYREHSTEEFSAYYAQGFEMRTVLLQCNREEMSELVCALTDRNIKHTEWLEQPENEVTAIAVCPYEKAEMQKVKELRILKLY